MINTTAGSEEYESTMFEAKWVEPGYCKGVWDGSRYDAEPQGRLRLYDQAQDFDFNVDSPEKRSEDGGSGQEGVGGRVKQMFKEPLRWFGTWWFR